MNKMNNLKLTINKEIHNENNGKIISVTAQTGWQLV